MNNWKISCVLILLILLLITGCSGEEEGKAQDKAEDVTTSEETTSSEEKLYKNDDLGLSVGSQKGWKLIEESDDPVNVKFQNEHVRSILTILSEQPDFQTLKDELLAGANDATVVEEDTRFIAFETDREESMRTEVYFMNHEEKTVLLSFVTPKKHYEMVKEDITAFRNQINY